MPHPCSIHTPCLSRARIKDSGTDAPPVTARSDFGNFHRPRSGEPSARDASKVCNKVIQIVGTPKANVGGSICIRSRRSPECRYGPGNTSFAPRFTAP